MCMQCRYVYMWIDSLYISYILKYDYLSMTCHTVSETNKWPAIFIWKLSFYFILDAAWKRHAGEPIASFYSDCIIINRYSQIQYSSSMKFLHRKCCTWLLLRFLPVFTCHPSIPIFMLCMIQKHSWIIFRTPCTWVAMIPANGKFLYHHMMILYNTIYMCFSGNKLVNRSGSHFQCHSSNSQLLLIILCCHTFLGKLIAVCLINLIIIQVLTTLSLLLHMLSIIQNIIKMVSMLLLCLISFCI